MEDRLDRIRDRALVMPVVKRTCSHCTLVYRHTAGVTHRGRWYCDVKCMKAGPLHPSKALLLRAIFQP